MPLESGTTISALIATWPLSGDFVSEGDNHLNLIKSILKKQFPGAENQGFNTPILSTEAELNFSQGARSNLQDQIDALQGIDPGGPTSEFPALTTMIFFQAAPPPGWTQLTANSDSMLRVVTGAGGGSGGTDTPIAHKHITGSVFLTLAQLPSELASNTAIAISGSDQSDSHIQTNSVARGNTTANSATSVPITIPGVQGNAHNHGDTDTARPRYIDVITAVKD